MAVYKGIAYPFIKDSTGVPAQVTDLDLIRQSVEQIIVTPRFSRVMRPNVGASVNGYIFENNDDTLRTMIEMDVRALLQANEPRIANVQVKVTSDGNNGAIAEISYIVPALQKQDSVAVKLTAG